MANPLPKPLRDWCLKPPPEALSTGLAEIDSALGQIPRGALTEFCGPRSCGRTSLLLATLAAATARQEVCALVDSSDAFDPESAAAAGVDLGRLLWVRCGGNAGHALKSAEWLAHGGGFGVLVLDLADLDTHRLPFTVWFRLQRAVEHTRTALVVIDREPSARTSASLVFSLSRERVAWQGVLEAAVVRIERRKPLRAAAATFEARAVA